MEAHLQDIIQPTVTLDWKQRPENRDHLRDYHRDYHREWRQSEARRQYERDWVRNNRRKLRDEAIIALGGPRCVVCGFDDVRALQIDHINGGGNKEIASLGNVQIYKKILRDPEQARLDYQILCANHNWIKRHENKEHAHDKKQPTP